MNIYNPPHSGEALSGLACFIRSLFVKKPISARIPAILLLIAATANAAEPTTVLPPGMERIEHFVVIYLENRSFDNLFGLFPGARGLADAKGALPQADLHSGRPLASLPSVKNTALKPPSPDPRFPANLPNQPWLIDNHVDHDERVPDLVHEFYTHQRQINGGRNDLFAALSDAGGLTMGHHDGQSTRLWALAKEYVLADNFFQAAFGGSFLNHMWLACACTPVFPDAPEAIRAKLDERGNLVKKGRVTPDGFAVNTIQPRGGPHRSGFDAAQMLPPQDAPTLGDRLNDKKISWAWYSGGWADAEADQAADDFQHHHQPYAYFANYARGSAARAEHLRDDSRLAGDIAEGRLPQVVFVKPRGRHNQHPGYANLSDADRYVDELIGRIKASRYWPKTAIIVTYDEFGGFWDHVAPPRGDRWGPGTRIPAIVVAPFAKKGYVDHTLYDTTSVLKTIEVRFGLPALSARDAAAQPMLEAFDFSH